MARKIAGLWCFNKEPGDVKGMHVNTTEHVSLWLYVERDGVQEWRLDSGVGCSANRVRTAAKAYALAWSGVRVDDSEMRYATAEIGEIPEAVLHDDYEYVPAENDTQASCYTLNAIDVEHGWKIGMDKTGNAVLSRDVSFLCPADYDSPESFEDDVEVVESELCEPVGQVEPEPAKTVPQPQQPMSELGGHTIVEFAHEFDRIYGVLYDADGNDHSIDYGSDIDAFDNHEYPRGVLEAFNTYREDFVASDRESAAFIRALRSFTTADGVTAESAEPGSAAVGTVEPEPVTAEIPEVPPRVESHEVVKTSDAIVVRRVVIPGGKSVKELSDVFGAYPRRPRGFRDSKGRRVAYVAFDKRGGVVAFRDFYELGSDDAVESAIADYLAAHDLKLAA